MGKLRTLPVPVTCSLWSQSWGRLRNEATTLVDPPLNPLLWALGHEREDLRADSPLLYIHRDCTGVHRSLPGLGLWKKRDQHLIGSFLLKATISFALSACIGNPRSFTRHLTHSSRNNIVWQCVLISSRKETGMGRGKSRLPMNLL